MRLACPSAPTARAVAKLLAPITRPRISSWTHMVRIYPQARSWPTEFPWPLEGMFSRSGLPTSRK